ncbi:MAG: DegQ family serine endoprotease [Alphaproteobacteria bacterium]|nr:DegQ family serine endoprotease [Alphaproteobacteria bacterium]
MCAGRKSAAGIWLGAAALALTLTLPLASEAQTSRPAPAAKPSRASALESFADLAEKLLPMVVNISTTSAPQQTARRSQNPREAIPTPQFPPGSPFEEFFRDFFERQERERGSGDRPSGRRSTSVGSGFIIDSSGIVVTNNHVIAEADEIRVTLHDDTTVEATIIARDTKTDLAVLRLKTERKLPAIKWGDSDKTRVGDWVIAIGNPFNLGGTVTVGILSARGRNINAGPYDDFLQTDASINRGNSGGPMFNNDGEVIGINTAIFSPSGGSVGLGFAIPAGLARPVIEQLLEYGKPRRGWLGVRIQTVTDEIAESLSLGETRGALIAGVAGDGPAKKAGIEAGDIVLTFDGKDVKDMRRLPRLVAETKIGKPVKVGVWRKGKSMTFEVKVGELPEDEQKVASVDPKPPVGKSETLATLGLTLSAINPETKQRFNLPDGARGVVVTEVNKDTPAAEKGLKPGDIIVEVGQEEVGAPAEVADKVKKIQDAKRKSVLLLVQSGDDLRFIALRLEGG